MFTPRAPHIIFVMLLSVGSGVVAGEAQSDLQVSATVASICEITNVNTVDFGTYNPLSGLNKDVAGSLTIRCNEGTIPTVKLDYGSNVSGTVDRRLKHLTENSYLRYDLFQDQNSSYATKWGNGVGGVNAFVPASSPAFTGTTYQIYGRIYPNANTPTGTYRDSVTITVVY